MPSLVDLQGAPVSDNIIWEAILVNRAADANLLKPEQKAMEMAVRSRSEFLNILGDDLVRKLAALVSDYVEGPVGDPDNTLKEWKNLSNSLKAKLGIMVLPLGSLTIGLARHRALLLKVLADSVGIPCRLVKGKQYTGSDDAAMNFVKTDDGREYIVDLMADPGTLIPSDAAGSHIEYEESFFSTSPFSRGVDSSHIASCSSGGGVLSLFEEHSESRNLSTARNESDDRGEYLPSTNLIGPIDGDKVSKMSDDSRNPSYLKELAWEAPSRANYPYSYASSPYGFFSGQRCQMCLRSDPLHKVIERLAIPGVRRLVIVEGPQMWAAGWQTALSQIGPNFIWWVVARSVFYHLYNQVSSDLSLDI